MNKVDEKNSILICVLLLRIQANETQWRTICYPIRINTEINQLNLIALNDGLLQTNTRRLKKFRKRVFIDNTRNTFFRL